MADSTVRGSGARRWGSIAALVVVVVAVDGLLFRGLFCDDGPSGQAASPAADREAEGAPRLAGAVAGPPASIEWLDRLDGSARLWVSPSGRWVAGQLAEPGSGRSSRSPMFDSSATGSSVLGGSPGWRLLDQDSGRVLDGEGILLGAPTDEGKTCRFLPRGPGRVERPSGELVDIAVEGVTMMAELVADASCTRFVAIARVSRPGDDELFGDEVVLGADGSGVWVWQRAFEDVLALGVSPAGDRVAAVVRACAAGEPASSPDGGGARTVSSAAALTRETCHDADRHVAANRAVWPGSVRRPDSGRLVARRRRLRSGNLGDPPDHDRLARRISAPPRLAAAPARPVLGDCPAAALPSV